MEENFNATKYLMCFDYKTAKFCLPKIHKIFCLLILDDSVWYFHPCDFFISENNYNKSIYIWKLQNTFYFINVIFQWNLLAGEQSTWFFEMIPYTWWLVSSQRNKHLLLYTDDLYLQRKLCTCITFYSTQTIQTLLSNLIQIRSMI